MNKNEFRQPVNGLHSIKIIQAFERGETIEVRLKGSGDSWEELDSDIKVFNFGACDYRIKKKKDKPGKSISKMKEKFEADMKKSSMLSHIQAQLTILRNVLDKRVANFDMSIISIICDIESRLSVPDTINMRREDKVFEQSCSKIEDALSEIRFKYNEQIIHYEKD